MGQRRIKRDRVKKPKAKPEPPPLRTKEGRQSEVKTIINKLTELNLTTTYTEITELMIIMKEYIDDGNERIIDIPFPAIGKRIVGKLTAYTDEPNLIKLSTKE